MIFFVLNQTINMLYFFQALGSSDFGNVLVSPLSLKLILSMLYEGASGSTKIELEHILEVTSSNQSLIREKFQRIIESLNKKSNDFALDLGSRIYMDNSINPQQRFAAMIEKFYNSDIKSVDFGNVLNTKEEINYWVSNVTHGHIRDLVSEGDLQDAILLIANALYFKGLWKSPFPKNQTYDGIFYTSPSQRTTLPYMYTFGSFYYFASNELDCKILRLPFKVSFDTILYTKIVYSPSKNLIFNFLCFSKRTFQCSSCYPIQKQV